MNKSKRDLVFDLLRAWFVGNKKIDFECDDYLFEIFWKTEFCNGFIQVNRECKVIGEIPPGFASNQFEAYCNSLLR
jgi:hypothetical protein